MSQKLRDWVRLDAKNVAVAGSNIRRPKRPVSGRWQEFEAIDCCGPELTYTPAAAIVNVKLTILCDAVAKLTLTLVDDTTTIYETVSVLNKNAGYLGYFSTDGTVITFQVKTRVKTAFCAGTLTFTVVAA